jgi:hypothetical protein
MKRWVAWGLAGVLAVVLLGSGVLLAVHMQSQVPRGQRWLALLPRDTWGVGRVKVRWLTGPPKPPEEWFNLGFFTVRLK